MVSQGLSVLALVLHLLEDVLGWGTRPNSVV